MDKSLIVALGKVISEERERTDEMIASLPKAKDGVDGASGADGSPGEIGETGEAGADGATGADGADGATGETGSEGAEGSPGAAGSPGEKGEQGDAGVTGETGSEGVAGVDGKDGLSGEPGVGLFSKIWEEGIYRKGEIVTAHMGQTYWAKSDTNMIPGESDDWERVGSGGFRWLGVKPKDHEYKEGDLYIDKGTTFAFFKGKGRMFAQRGKDGSDGKQGAPGASIEAIKVSTGGIAFAFDSGEVIETNIEGLSKLIESIATTQAYIAAEEKALSIFEQAAENDGKYGTPIKTFRGLWDKDDSYRIGDVVSHGKAFYIAVETPKGGYMALEDWVPFGGGSGGSSGGGSAGDIASGTLNMVDHLIVNLRNPRVGVAGRTDAVNRHSMEIAIAAGSLYQGLTLPTKGCPEVLTAVDSGFVAPIADEEVNKPTVIAPITLPSPATGRCAVWFEMAGSIYDAFTIDPDSTITVAVETHIKILISSDMRWRSATIPAGDYKLAQINALFVPLNGISFGGVLGTVKMHLVATTAPVALTPWLMVESDPDRGYAFIVEPQSSAAFPPFALDSGTPPTLPPTVPKPDNSPVGHTWNWIIETKDSEVPEYIPPGIPGLLAGTLVDNGDRLQWNEKQRPDPANPGKFLGGMDLIRGASLTKHSADRMYWQVDGSNMYWSEGSEYKLGSIVIWNLGIPNDDTTNNRMFWRAIQHVPATIANPSGIPTDPAIKTEPGHSEAMFEYWHPMSDNIIFIGHGTWNKAVDQHNRLHRWGMPEGCHPEDRHPVTGDIYLDLLTGNWIDFIFNEVDDTLSIEDTIFHYGNRRDFEITIDGSSGNERGILKGISADPAVYIVRIKEKGGSEIYEFRYVQELAGDLLEPIVMLAQNGHFKSIVSSLGRLGVDLSRDTSVLYEVTIETENGDLDHVEICTGTETSPGAATARFDAVARYPSDVLVRMNLARGGDLHAAQPNGVLSTANHLWEIVATRPSQLNRFKGLWYGTTATRPLVEIRKGDGVSVSKAEMTLLFTGQSRPGKDALFTQSINDIMAYGGGFMGITRDDVIAGTVSRFEIEVDNRDGNHSCLRIKVWTAISNSGRECVLDEMLFTAGFAITAVRLSAISSTTPVWRIYED